MVLYGIVVILVYMQGWNEKVSKSIQRIQKNRLAQWFYDKDISTQYRILFIILASVIIIWNIVNIYFNSFKIDDVSARYLLSALVQSLAAIIAIVVTLTLVAVQLTASVYSPRVIDIFKENKVMWLLLAWYGLSIFFGLFVLEMIGGGYSISNSWCITVPLEICVFLAYLMGIIAFAGLFWHIGNVIDLLKPENIIKRLAVEITEDKILNPKKDPIQPIMDIIHVSIMKYDIATVECGLDAVMKNAEYILYISKYSDDEYTSICFCGRLGTAGRCALRAGEDESAMEVIGCLKDIATLAIEMHSDKSAKAAVQYVEIIGTVAAEKKLRFVTCDAMKSLKDVGILAAKNQLGDLALQAIDSLGNVGMYAAENKIEIAAQYAAKYLGCVGECAAENELENAAKQAVDSLGVIGNYAIENKLKNATEQVAESFGDVGKAVAEKGLGDAASKVVKSLWDIGEIVAEKGFDDATSKVVESLKDVGTSAAEKGREFENVATQVAVSLGTVGKITVKKELENAISQVVESLGSVGVSAAKNRLNDTMWYVASSLGDVGISAAEKGNEFEQIVTHVARRLQRVYPQGYKNENVLLRVVSSLGDVGVSAAENRLNDATSEVVRSLVGVGQSAAEEGKGFEHVIQCAVVSLVGVGTAIEKEELKHVTVEAVQSLAKSTISSEKIVKTTIRELKQEEPDRSLFQKHIELYERPIRQDRDSFQKFINLYEQ